MDTEDFVVGTYGEWQSLLNPLIKGDYIFSLFKEGNVHIDIHYTELSPFRPEEWVMFKGIISRNSTRAYISASNKDNQKLLISVPNIGAEALYLTQVPSDHGTISIGPYVFAKLAVDVKDTNAPEPEEFKSARNSIHPACKVQ